jgi:phosphoribosyl 1,2-cyclic phosphate phosphodiesterase
MKVTVLGCGGSGGVPLIGNVWGACNPHNPKNRRRRVSVFVQSDTTNILIDCGPDLREQLISVQATKIDATLVTHVHADHVHGIDDLRRLFFLNSNTPVPLYASQSDIEVLQLRFPYAFKPFSYDVKPVPPLLPVSIEGPFMVGDIEVIPFKQNHGKIDSWGFRIGDFAYSTDVKTLSEEAFTILGGVKTWLVDCVREHEHPAHSHLAQTLEWIARVKPERAYLTHMDTSLDYDELLAKCPPGVEPAYDGLELELA